MSRPLNVVLVEDNPDDVFLMRAILKRAALAYSLVVLEDGAQAIEYMRELAERGPESFPDLMFIDLNLPRKNGHEVLSEIRTHSTLDKLPIVILTTSEDPLDKSKALANGALRYTSKPPNLTTLNQILQEAKLSGLGLTDDTRSNPKPPLENRSNPSGGESSAAVSIRDGTGTFGTGTAKIPDRILLIEDSPSDALFLQTILRKAAPGAYDLEVVTDVASALKALEKKQYRVILADLGLPDAHGLQVLSKLHAVASKVPVVIMTGLDDEKKAAEAVEQGAQDYLVKGNVDGDRLVRSIRYAIMRKRADELARLAITIENNALKEILEHAPISIARFDSDLTILACNSVFSKQLELDQSAVLGLRVNKLLPMTDLNLWQQVVKSGQPFHTDRCQPRKDSELTWDLTAWPVTTGEGDIKGGITVGLDITERIKIERQREDFAAALAHDIANPLVGVDRILTALSDTPLGQAESEQGNFLSLLKASNSNVLGMLHNLLDVYRYDTAAMQLDIQTLEPVPPMKSAIQATASLAAEKQIAVSFNTDPDLRTISADPIALQRLFTNLLDNALRFATNGDEVKINARNKKDSGKGVVFEIIDNGPGMDVNEQELLFKRFGQNSDGQLKVGPGNGLGLYLCKQIVDAHGGQIKCQSAPGKGTTFIVVLN